MFKFLKDKLKDAVSKISKKAEKEIEEPVKEDVKVEEIKPEPVKEKPKKEKKKKEEKKEEIVEEEVKEEPVVEEVKEEVKEKKGFFKRLKEVVTTKTISEEKFDGLFWDLEVALLENNVAVEVIEKIKNDLKGNLVNAQLKRGKIEETIVESLKDSINELFDLGVFDLFEEIKKKKPYVIAFVGINGSGKTTTIAKVAHLLKEKGISVVLGAADSFRASAIEQLEEWGRRLDIKVIKHDYGSDPAAISFDTIKFAEAKGLDVVLIDTAGRMHSNKDLMREIGKVVRVTKPDLKIFVGEALAGNDAVLQCNEFNSAIGIDGVILTKQDIDEKGGAAISISYVTRRPILYIGTGQTLESLEKFDKEKVIKNIGLDGD